MFANIRTIYLKKCWGKACIRLANFVSLQTKVCESAHAPRSAIDASIMTLA